MFIPIKVDVPTDRYPIANVLLMALIICISIAGFANEKLILELGGAGISESGYGTNVYLDTSQYPLPVLAITSTVVHAGWIHLAGNMLFMYIFGYGVNYKFGHIAHVLLFVLAGFIASMTHYAMDPTPAIGASGAVYGLMGAYLIYFCRNNVTIFWIIFVFYFGYFTVSSGWMIAVWVGWDILMLYLGWQGGTAIWAHLGGFFTGVVFASVALRLGWVRPSDYETTLYELLGVNADWARS